MNAGDAPVGGRDADSIVMERTRCFGTCPAYRLRIARTGAVHFQSRNPGDESRTATDTIAAERFGWLVGEAERVGLFGLPERIMGDTALCAIVATDHPTVTTTIYAPARTKRVEHYTGCHGPRGGSGRPAQLQVLMPFYAAVDSVAGARRWIRSAPFRSPSPRSIP